MLSIRSTIPDAGQDGRRVEVCPGEGAATLASPVSSARFRSCHPPPHLPYPPGFILDIQQEHSLSADGKTLSITHSEKWENKRGISPRPMVFDRLNKDAGKAQNPQKGDDSSLFSKDQLIEDSRQLLNYFPEEPDNRCSLR